MSSASKVVARVRATTAARMDGNNAAHCSDVAVRRCAMLCFVLRPASCVYNALVALVLVPICFVNTLYDPVKSLTSKQIPLSQHPDLHPPLVFAPAHPPQPPRRGLSQQLPRAAGATTSVAGRGPRHPSKSCNRPSFDHPGPRLQKTLLTRRCDGRRRQRHLCRTS